jgi:hypothetical protein
MTLSVKGTSDTRYSFVGQHLRASAAFVRRIRDIERLAPDQLNETIVCEHRGLVCAVIFQCAAALETEAHEACVYGPGSYLGSNGTDQEAQRFLSPIADVVDDQETVARFNFILHVLHRQALDKGSEPYQSAALVVRLRNELVHYKSRWGAEMESCKLYRALEAMGHLAPPFVSETTNFFPHRCLNADCAAWALRSAVALLEAFYEALGVPSRFESYRERLVP